MMTLMRNGRTVDRKTREVPREERTRAFGWDRSADHIRASSQTAALKGRIHGCTRTLREKVRFFSLAPRAPSIHGTGPPCWDVRVHGEFWRVSGRTADIRISVVSRAASGTCRNPNHGNGQQWCYQVAGLLHRSHSKGFLAHSAKTSEGFHETSAPPILVSCSGCCRAAG